MKARYLILFVAAVPLRAAELPSLLPAGAKELSTTMQIVILMTLLTLLPAILLTMTAFTRIIIVLIQPLGVQIYRDAWQPMEAGKISGPQAWETGTKPLKIYLGRFVREKDVQLFLDITHAPRPRTSADLDLAVLAPAYVLSEMRAGFQIGAVLFLPFLLIDIIVASVTLSIGMVQLPPVMVSAPFKLLLFVLVDGWNLTVGSLMKGFYV
jgi:flagellar biosynthetic protein FliP